MNDKKLKPVDLKNPSAEWVPIIEALEKLTHLKDKEFLEKIMGYINS